MYTQQLIANLDHDVRPKRCLVQRFEVNVWTFRPL